MYEFIVFLFIKNRLEAIVKIYKLLNDKLVHLFSYYPFKFHAYRYRLAGILFTLLFFLLLLAKYFLNMRAKAVMYWYNFDTQF